MDAAQAALVQAKDDLVQTTLVSPLAGTVGAVGLTVGESVQAASTASAGSGITVIGAGTSYAVETSVADSDLAKVHVGQAASAIVDGSATALTGTVVGIGLLPTSSLTSGSNGGGSGASSSVSYPVTISLNRASQRIFSGSDADVSIVIAQAANATAVPSSALRSLGQIQTVTVVRGGKATTTIVGVGAAGTTLTQITSGVKVGDRVVLADLSTPLPSAGTTTGRGGGLGGALGGGGLGGGGLGAGGLGGGRAGASVATGQADQTA
ncbi:efflux RND transporter periplasmic adaptor subunit [Frankia sp. AvcI1]|uniref:efflux RND transporter periplasmic adaptor subunit n=1 Tax=Frankia sp. AvcI1 TaxID=573496 RepID=UPI0006EC0D14|nr:HlyD family efflux transporter periplasmic adaptor subunit [Frankia sp. AvcI1]